MLQNFKLPLSHLSILGKNRKIPIAAYKKAFQDSGLLALDKEKVCIEVLADTFKIELINKLKTTTRAQQKINLIFNLEVDSVISIENINHKSYKCVGNKTANFAALYHLSKKHDFKVPECAFAIPFYFYHQHISTSSASKLIDSLLQVSESLDINSLKFLLRNIQKEILAHPLNTSLLKSVNSKVTANNNYTRLRFRSSTNAEDAKGFSGAGIYASKTGIFNHGKKTFEKAIKKVWASLWSFEAFSEREYYNIDHKDVYMGILVHRSFPDEEVNGVAITKNLYMPESYGFVVNAQIGEESVVKPKQGITSDQFICYPDNVTDNKYAIDIITQSNLNDDKLVMSADEIKHLANQLEIIKKHILNQTPATIPYKDFGLDIEFKLDKEERVLYIKQVRIFND